MTGHADKERRDAARNPHGRLVIGAQWIASSLIFFALPLLLIAYGAGATWQTEEESLRRTVFERLDAVLLNLRARENTNRHLAALFNRLYDLALASPDRTATLRRGFTRLGKRFPGMFHIAVVDAHGELIPSVSDPGLPRSVVRMLFQALHEYHIAPGSLPVDARDDRLRQRWPVLQSYVGDSSNWTLFRSNVPDIEEVSIRNRRRWFFHRVDASGGLFVHIDHAENWVSLAMSDIVSEARRRHPDSPLQIGVSWDYGIRNPTTPEQQVLAAFQNHSRSHQAVHGRFFSVMPLSTSGFVLASLPDTLTGTFLRKRLLLAAAIALLFGILTIWSRRFFYGGGAESTLPIRARLVLLFGFTAGIPLLVVLFAGWDYVNQKHARRIRETHEELERTLYTIDANFLTLKGRWQERLVRALSGVKCRTQQEVEAVKRLLTKAARVFSCVDVVLFDARGKVAWSTYDENRGLFARSARESNRKFLGSLVRRCMAGINDVEIDTTLDPASIVIESLAGLEELNAMLNRGLRLIHNYSLGNNNYWCFLMPLIQPDGTADYMATCYWGAGSIERGYLRRETRSAQKKWPGVVLCSFGEEGGDAQPADSPFLRPLAPFLEKMRQRQGTTFQTLRFRGETWLVTGIKGRELGRFFLIALTPDTPIRSEAAAQHRIVRQFAGICALISLFLGLVLSRSFLLPIRELLGGVEAIRRREFGHRVGVFGRDEFGDLALTFNEVMEGLKDLEIGRIVQTSLLPQSEAAVGEYRVFGRCRTAFSVGGDYFEIQVMTDGRLLVLIGDVSGHGVPAALVMAMAKALVDREIARGRIEPENLLLAMHQVFHRTLQKQKMMTCFAAVVDPAEHLLSYANAGHNYPVLFRNGTATLLDLPAVPLGTRAKATFPRRDLRMEPGDILLLYTDGLVEARSRGEQIGYERLLERGATLRGSDPRALCDALFAWHESLADPGPADDDVTVLVLTRANEPTRPVPDAS